MFSFIEKYYSLQEALPGCEQQKQWLKNEQKNLEDILGNT